MKRLRRKAMTLPLEPGVYIMKNKNGDIIYIGKAKKLKNRVSQYFGSNTNHGIKTIKMVENVDEFDYIVVASEYEALVLECSLIKQYRPKYNILLKDDKGYSYIKISGDEWKKITLAKQKLDDGAQYLGPYTSSYYISTALDEAAKVFKLPTCSKIFPRDYKKGRPCLNYFIGRCSAPCAGKVTKEEYAESVNEAINFLRGGVKSVSVKEMEKEMFEAAENCEFERAARLRDRIRAFEKLKEKQVAVLLKEKHADVFAVAHAADASCMSVLRIKDGKIFDAENFIIDTPEDAKNELMQLVVGYYSIRDYAPRLIILDFEVDDPALLQQWLSERFGYNVRVVGTGTAENMRLAHLCRNNGAQHLSHLTGRGTKEMKAVDELGVLLGIGKAPTYIESYDISHTAGSDPVGAMIVFKDGKPYKTAYKKFAIKTAVGGDDCASMYEVISRRAQRYLDEKGLDGFGTLPDVMLIDGGLPQVNAANSALSEKGIYTAVFGMVKDSKHRTRALVNENGEIAINMHRGVFSLIGNIQEEVHRFAITFHKSKHTKSARANSLTKIDGVGEKRAKALFSYFRSIEKIRNASVEELCSVPTITKPIAENIYKWFRKED
ncbi:MAG: excinuclease ABC subunit UvrC [Clostridia bacterium]|nr:excinuclease ABC subunit UvrC [Clostridia bacterium]